MWLLFAQLCRLDSNFHGPAMTPMSISTNIFMTVNVCSHSLYDTMETSTGASYWFDWFFAHGARAPKFNDRFARQNHALRSSTCRVS